MPKIKTHKATAKRFSISGSGKLMRTRIGKSHLRRKKPSRVRTLFDETFVVQEKRTVRRVQHLAPYLKKKRK